MKNLIDLVAPETKQRLEKIIEEQSQTIGETVQEVMKRFKKDSNTT